MDIIVEQYPLMNNFGKCDIVIITVMHGVNAAQVYVHQCVSKLIRLWLRLNTARLLRDTVGHSLQTY